MGTIPFDYVIQATALANGGNVDASITLTDQPFVVEEITYSAFISSSTGGASTGTPLVELPSAAVGSNTGYFASQLTAKLDIDGQNSSNAHQPIDALCGTKYMPRMLRRPWELPQKSVVKANFVNATGAPVTARIILRGFKVTKD